MPIEQPVPNPAPESAESIINDLVGAVLNGNVEPRTRHLLHAASGGEPVLLRALVATALGVGALTLVDGRWQWVLGTSRAGRVSTLLSTRASTLEDQQLKALRMLTRPWAEPYAVVAQEVRDRQADEVPAEGFGLTHREHQVLAMLGDGLPAQAIARTLNLSPRTIAKYQERIYRKLGTSDRLTTVLRAQSLGLLRQPPNAKGKSSA
jgi:DNA-binding NarL/FixJ family response regulator